MHGLSPVAVSRGYSLVAGSVLLIAMASHVADMSSRHAGFSSCNMCVQQLGT